MELEANYTTHLRMEGRSVLFVKVDDNSQTHENVVLVIRSQQLQHQRQNALDVGSNDFRHRQAVNHLENLLSHL